MALPMRPSGAMRLMRIGWSAGRMSRRVMAKGGAPRNRTAPRPRRLLPENLLLEQHRAAEMPILPSLAASRFALARSLRHERVHFFLAHEVLGRRRHVVEDLDQIEVGLAGTLIVVPEAVVILDPALRFGEFFLLPPLSREIVGVGGKMTVVDRDLAHVPEVAARERDVLGRRRNGNRYRRRAKRGKNQFAHL